MTRSVVLDELAGQLGIADPSCVKRYVERSNTRWEHRREICWVDGWREFGSVREELSRWIDHRAGTTGSGAKAIFDGVIVWLRQRQVLLPAVKELERLVSRVAREAHGRLWSALVDLLTAGQARLLLDLLEVPHGRRFSALEVLRRGPVDRTGKALVAALNRVVQVAGIGLGEMDLGMVPQRRVVELAHRGMTSNATDLRRTMPYSKRSATLLATVVYLEAKATDDARELFDVIMTNEPRRPPHCASWRKSGSRGGRAVGAATGSQPQYPQKRACCPPAHVDQHRPRAHSLSPPGAAPRDTRSGSPAQKFP